MYDKIFFIKKCFTIIGHVSIRKRHKGVVEIVKRLLAEDGWRGFMRGAVARLHILN